MVVGPSLPAIYNQQFTRFTLRSLRNWDYVGVALLILKNPTKPTCQHIAREKTRPRRFSQDYRITSSSIDGSHEAPSFFEGAKHLV